MANQFANAHDELVACQSAEFGTACEATIGTQTVAAVVGAMMFADELVPGGVAMQGTQVVAVKKSLLTSFADEPNGEPPKFTVTSIRGVTAQVLDVDERDGIFYITTGDPVASE